MVLRNQNQYCWVLLLLDLFNRQNLKYVFEKNHGFMLVLSIILQGYFSEPVSLLIFRIIGIILCNGHLVEVLIAMHIGR